MNKQREAEIRSLVQVGPDGTLKAAWDHDPRLEFLAQALADVLAEYDEVKRRLQSWKDEQGW